MREQFEKAEDEESKKKGKGKGKAPESPPEAGRNGKGAALMIRRQDGYEVDDAGLGPGKARLRLDLGTAGSEDTAPTQWEDSAEKDDEDLYGDGGA